MDGGKKRTKAGNQEGRDEGKKQGQRKGGVKRWSEDRCLDGVVKRDEVEKERD